MFSREGGKYETEEIFWAMASIFEAQKLGLTSRRVKRMGNKSSNFAWEQDTAEDGDIPNIEDMTANPFDPLHPQFDPRRAAEHLSVLEMIWFRCWTPNEGESRL